MASATKTTVTRLRNENERLKKDKDKLLKRIDVLEHGAYCSVCGEIKPKTEFYLSSDPVRRSGVTPICKECAKDIAGRVDGYGDRHEPTKTSVRMACRYLDKPYSEKVFDTSVLEKSNIMKASNRNLDVFSIYMKNIAMKQYSGMTYDDSDVKQSDIPHEKVIYPDEADKKIMEESKKKTDLPYSRDRKDTIRLLGYDPFEKEAAEDKPFLYSHLLGMLDSSEDMQDDMLRTNSIIAIVRSFLQLSKIDNAISRLMYDISNMERNAASIKSLQESKAQIQRVITNLAAESCISLKNSKQMKKGENTWTGKIRKIREMNLRDAEINGFDIETCKGMQQVANISVRAILDQLHLDESEYSDMLAEQRQMIDSLGKEVKNAKEVLRILLRENLDLRNLLQDNNLLDKEQLVDLEELLFTDDTVQDDEMKMVS